MVAFAEMQPATGLRDQEIYEQVKASITRQFEELQSQEEQIVPFRLKSSSRHLFRTRPGHVLRMVCQLDLPAEEWLSPSDLFGRLRLSRYKERTEIPVPGLEGISWGKLNRIVQRQYGGRVIVFNSVAATKESWFATNDAWIAMLLREWIRRATTPQYSYSDFRHCYEVDQGAFIMVGDRRFSDDAEGWAMAQLYARMSGIKSIQMGSDDQVAGELLGEIDLTEEYVKRNELSVAEARDLFADNESDLIAPPAGPPAPEGVDPTATVATVAAAPARPKGKGKAKKADPVPDVLDTFEEILAEQERHGIVPTDMQATAQAGDSVLGDASLVDAEEGSIADLVNDFIEVNGDDDSRTAPPDDSAGAG